MAERPPDGIPDETAPMPGPLDETVVAPPRGSGGEPPRQQPPVADVSGSGRSGLLWLAIAALAVGIGALVVGVIALTDEDAAPAEAVAGGLIGTDNIADGAVTNQKIAAGAVGLGKLADGSVGDAKIASGAIGEAALAEGAVSNSRLAEAAVGQDKLEDGAVATAKIQKGAVTGAQVADDSIGGQQVDESSLGTVPSAETAEMAAVSEVALSLEGGGGGGGNAPTVEFVMASSDTDPASAKGPIVAACPDGSQVISGGAAVVGADGAGVPVALVLNTPSGNGWAGAARAYEETDAGWSIDVTATCAPLGGS